MKVVWRGRKRSFEPRKRKASCTSATWGCTGSKQGCTRCKRLLGDLCTVGPKDLLHPLLSTFEGFSEIFGPSPRRSLVCNVCVAHEWAFLGPIFLHGRRPGNSRKLGARLRGHTATQRSKKGSEKVLGRVLGKVLKSALRRGACYGFYSKKRVLRRVLRRGSEKGISRRCLERLLGEYDPWGGCPSKTVWRLEARRSPGAWRQVHRPLNGPF